MSGLDFLSLDRAGDVLARSPMHRLAAAAGATFESRAGWEVAVGFGPSEAQFVSATVGFADRSHLTKLEVHGGVESLARIAREAGDGVALELARGVAKGGVWWCPITPTKLLVLAEPGDSVKAAVSAAADPDVTVVDLSCGLAAMSLVGPGCRELLARFCAIDVRPAITPVGGFRPGSIARTPGYLLRERDDQLLLLVGWAFGEYLWEVVADAAQSLGGGPVGADALTGEMKPAHA